MNIPDANFFMQQDTLWLAKELLGMELITRFDGKETAGIILETEAYLGETDRASHAYGGRRTQRTETMYLRGGHAYVYLCYGMHHLFNIVTNLQDVPHAILIRAVEPTRGLEHMLARRKKEKPDFSVTRGPGSVSQALGIHKSHSGILLQQETIIIADNRLPGKHIQIESSARIGVDYAGEDALLPYRFFVKNSPWVSGKKIKTGGS